MLAPAVLATAAFTTPALATPVWSVITPGGAATTRTGTLSNTTITLTGALTISTAPSVNPPYNTYDIWDNAAAANTAQIWPATAMGQEQILVAARATQSHLTVTFGRPVVNPQMLVYSLDNSYINYSTTLTTAGTPGIVSVVKNPAATYDAGLKRLSSVGGGGVPEGCASTGGRGCAVVTFIGTYSQLDMDIQTTVGGNDGLGMQFGVDPAVEAAMHSVPTLSQWGLLLMALLLAGTAGTVVRRRNPPTR